MDPSLCVLSSSTDGLVTNRCLATTRSVTDNIRAGSARASFPGATHHESEAEPGLPRNDLCTKVVPRRTECAFLRRECGKLPTWARVPDESALRIRASGHCGGDARLRLEYCPRSLWEQTHTLGVFHALDRVGPYALRHHGISALNRGPGYYRPRRSERRYENVRPPFAESFADVGSCRFYPSTLSETMIDKKHSSGDQCIPSQSPRAIHPVPQCVLRQPACHSSLSYLDVSQSHS